MLSATLAHLDPVAPAELWRAWNWDPVLLLGFATVGVLYARGCRASGPPSIRRRWQRRAFVLAMVTFGVALVSPLDAASNSLASAHMIQHLLLTIVAAPLLVISAPSSTMLRGLPAGIRRDVGHLRRTQSFRLGPWVAAHPIALALVHVFTLWIWHARAPYEAALDNDLLHRLEHVTFVVTAMLSWAAILMATRHRRGTLGAGVLVLFGLSVQGSILGALLTFATEPWYPRYAATTEPWGLTPLADLHLAGVIMWVPAGVVYLVAALGLLIRWINLPAPQRPVPPSARTVLGGERPAFETVDAQKRLRDDSRPHG